MSPPSGRDVDAVVIGAGPNGLAAAITLAERGRSVVVFEAHDEVGGGTRTAELTQPGFLHDVCSAVHPMAAASPFLRSLPLADLGVELVHPELPLAHPLDGGRAGILHRSVDATAAGLGDDEAAYHKLFGPLIDRWDHLGDELLGPLLRVPRHPFALARFGLRAIWSAERLARRFHTDEARGLLAGCAGHSFLPLGAPLTASFALVLAGFGHAVGWPFIKGGSQRLTEGLARHLQALGGEVVTGHRVESLASLPPADVVLADVTPRQLADMAGDWISSRDRRRLLRFRYGPGVCKVDYALSEPVPWAADACRRAGTVHVGGTFEEVAVAEAEVVAGRAPEQPFILCAQPSLFDPTRAPDGRHVLWAYCHVPNGFAGDVSDRIDAQIERFAPGFRDVVLDRHVMTAPDFEAYNASFVGGDIAGGSHRGLQLLARPRPARNPYATPVDGVYLCSASTPPGAGVHGMCGVHAARSTPLA